MSVRRPVVIAAAAIAALFVGAVVLLDRLFADPATSQPAQRPVAEAPPIPPPAQAAAQPSAAAPPPEAPPPSAAPPAPVVRDLLTSLAEARRRILDCAGVTPEAPPPGPRKTWAARRRDPTRPRTVVLLDLEPLDDQMVVHGLEVVSPGGHDGEDLVRCARQELVGKVLEAAKARPGKRLKMQYDLDRLGP